MTDTTATADPTVDPTITSAVERLMRRVEDFPAAGVWVAIVIAALFTRTDWKVVPASLKLC